jgi:poly(A) polymerase
MLENMELRELARDQAYEFLLLRAESGEVDPELAAWWTRLQQISPEERIAEVEGQPRAPGDEPKRRRPRRRRRPAA